MHQAPVNGNGKYAARKILFSSVHSILDFSNGPAMFARFLDVYQPDVLFTYGGSRSMHSFAERKTTMNVAHSRLSLRERAFFYSRVLFRSV